MWKRTLAVAVSLTTAALLLPALGARTAHAQFLFQEQEPRVDSAQEQWQIAGEPITLDGLIYDPAGPDRFFDANVMTRTGVYRGIPVYQDRTLEPHSIVYIPIGRRMMRPYERRRTGELAGTQGSRAPEPPSTPTPPQPAPDIAAGASGVGLTGRRAQTPAPAGTAGTLRTTPNPATTRRTTVLESIPAPSGPNGLHIEFNGSRWYNAGPPRAFAENEFVEIGSYAGFPVYRLRNETQDRIWVLVVPGGALAQYSRR